MLYTVPPKNCETCIRKNTKLLGLPLSPSLYVVENPKICKLTLAFLGNIRYAKGAILLCYDNLIVIETIILFSRRSEGYEVRIF